ncbi:MAG: hypothetical protein UZ21_OP11001000851 [Microgenomates bacterium OLB22]|nr:MAG: hypothetical protein UZ21_OP11001000851 [Microgenomates bacterium OLB22]
MRLKNVLLAFLIVILSLLSFSPSHVLASCAPAVSLAEYKDQADIVVLGQVTSISDTSAIVNVELYFKGHGGPSQIEVTGQESKGAVTSVDFTFEENRKYLLFLKMDSGNLKTNACMGNKEVSDALTSEDLAVLGTGYSPSGNTQDLSSSEGSERQPSNPNINFMLVTGGLLILGVVAVSWKKLQKKR